MSGLLLAVTWGGAAGTVDPFTELLIAGPCSLLLAAFVAWVASRRRRWSAHTLARIQPVDRAATARDGNAIPYRQGTGPAGRRSTKPERP